MDMYFHTGITENRTINKCHALMNEAIELRRRENDPDAEQAIRKYHDAFQHVPEYGTLRYPESGYSTKGGNSIRSEICRHIANTYRDLRNVQMANKYYDKALEYNPDNKDALHDKVNLPYVLNARHVNQGASGCVAVYKSDDSDKIGSLYSVVITDD